MPLGIVLEACIPTSSMGFGVATSRCQRHGLSARHSLHLIADIVVHPTSVQHCVWSQVMQVYPTELAGRRQLHDYQLNAGKATMVSQGDVACQYEADINLLDVFDLPMSIT